MPQRRPPTTASGGRRRRRDCTRRSHRVGLVRWPACTARLPPRPDPCPRERTQDRRNLWTSLNRARSPRGAQRWLSRVRPCPRRHCRGLYGHSPGVGSTRGLFATPLWLQESGRVARMLRRCVRRPRRCENPLRSLCEGPRLLDRTARVRRALVLDAYPSRQRWSPALGTRARERLHLPARARSLRSRELNASVVHPS